MTQAKICIFVNTLTPKRARCCMNAHGDSYRFEQDLMATIAVTSGCMQATRGLLKVTF